MTKNRQQVTLKSIGEILKLDASSVSLALRNSSKISTATRRRVQELAARYNYLPNLAARQLRSSKFQLIGLVLPEVMSSLVNPMAARIIQLLAEHAAVRGMVFQIVSAKNLVEASINQAAAPLVPDALYIWGDVPRSIAERQMDLHRSVVVVDPNHLSYSDYSGPSICIDNQGGGAAIARFLVERNTKRLLLVQVRSDHWGHRQRLEGARKEWLAHRPVTSINQCRLAELTDEDLQRLAREQDGAIFCSNDWGALQIWHRLNRLGLVTPRDIRLAGFDGEEAALLAGITTVLFDWQKVAEAAATMLFQAMEGNSKTSHDSISIATEIYAGQTA